MNEAHVDRESEALLPRSVDGLIEPILAALRHRDGEALKRLAEEASDAARQARAQLVLKGAPPDLPSKALGALEALESITSRAAARHDRNAELEAARLAGARRLMVALGQSKEGYLTPTEAARQVKMKSPNLTRLVKRLREAGLVEESQVLSQNADARQRPIKLAEAGRRVLDRLDPGWELLGVYAADTEGNDEIGDEHQGVTTQNESPALTGESVAPSNWDDYFATVKQRIAAALAQGKELLPEPPELRTSLDRNLIVELGRGNHRLIYSVKKMEPGSMWDPKKNDANDRLNSLTRRELEVLQLTAQGLVNKQIAGRLGTAEQTVKVHRNRLMHKMQAESLEELVQYYQGSRTASLSNLTPGDSFGGVPKGRAPRNAPKVLRTGRAIT
jgi:DNA-binding CsgD family transcriptional regulator/DNA-binding MarR family transcriptional regulator